MSAASQRDLARLQEALARLQALRADQARIEADLKTARNERERTRAELVSLDALQKAALGEADREAGKWLQAAGLAQRPRVTAQIFAASCGEARAKTGS